MKKFLAIILASVMIICFAACSKDKDENSNTGDDTVAPVENVFNEFRYTVNESGNYEITKYVPASSALIDITIPSEIEGRPVTSIGAEAFKKCNTIKSVTIPDSVTYIGSFAFVECDYLTSVTMANSVTKIGKGAFEKCFALENVTLSNELTEIGNYAFMYCAKLSSCVLNNKLETIGESAFMGCDSLETIVIPDSVKSIGDAAFYHCDKLADVTVGGGEMTLGKEIFNACADTMIVHTPEGSTFETYAKAQGYSLAEKVEAPSENA